MITHGRIVRGVVAAASIIGTSHLAAALEVPIHSLRAMRDDAALRDVCFVDASTGWAVGDRGVIWHTDDGGATWQQQPSGVSCSLRSVTFIDNHVGWAAGGYVLPYTGVTQGVVLASRDGGRHWSVSRPAELPAIRSIRFFNRQRAVAVTQSSPYSGAAVYSTADGGVHWKPMAGESTSPWTAGDFVDPQTGAVVGHSGATAAVRRESVDVARTHGGTLRRVHDVVLRPPRFGWLAGDGGLLQRTTDLGKSWRAPPGPLPENIARHFDLHAIAVDGPRCWVVGSPGTVVLRTTDDGRTWTTRATGVRVPLHAIAMVDQRTGWAVGGLGTVLATRDGGASWQLQRSGGTRVAYLGMFAESADVPLEMVAHFSAGLGYLGQIELLGRAAASGTSMLEADWQQRLEMAVTAAGGNGASTAWRFPMLDRRWMPTERQWHRELDRATDGRGVEALHKHLVRAIRMWQPSVVVTAAAEGPPRGSAAGRHMQRAVATAVDAAADPTRHVDLVQDAHLAPWTVARVLASTPHQQPETIRIDTYRVWPRSPQATADVATLARGRQTRVYRGPRRWLHFRVLRDGSEQMPTVPSLFAGIAIASGSGARRARGNLDVSNFTQRKRTARRQANLREIIEHRAEPAQLTQVSALLDDATPGTAGHLLFQLAARHVRQGRWAMAEDAYRLLVRRFPEHPLSDAALLWLVQSHCSSEAALRVTRDRAHRHVLRTFGRPDSPAASGLRAPGADAESPTKAGPVPGRSGRDAGPVERAVLADTASDQRWTAAFELSRQHRTRRRLFDDPRIRFPLAAAHRKRGSPRLAQRYLTTIQIGSSPRRWTACAEGERWLSTRNGPAPKPVAFCARATAPPYLDGALDESCWTPRRSVFLGKPSSSPQRRRTEVRLAYDTDFLYVAWKCARPDNDHHPIPATSRAYDADLSDEDRVALFLDVDRDYVTWYRLAIDQRGRPQDACWGDTSWNPTWYIATDRDDTTWWAEAAIRLDQLAEASPRPGTAWGLGARRTIPGTGIQTWGPSSSTSISDRGYLIFE